MDAFVLIHTTQAILGTDVAIRNYPKFHLSLSDKNHAAYRTLHEKNLQGHYSEGKMACFLVFYITIIFKSQCTAMTPSINQL